MKTSQILIAIIAAALTTCQGSIEREAHAPRPKDLLLVLDVPDPVSPDHLKHLDVAVRDAARACIMSRVPAVLADRGIKIEVTTEGPPRSQLIQAARTVLLTTPLTMKETIAARVGNAAQPSPLALARKQLLEAYQQHYPGRAVLVVSLPIYSVDVRVEKTISAVITILSILALQPGDPDFSDEAYMKFGMFYFANGPSVQPGHFMWLQGVSDYSRLKDPDFLCGRAVRSVSYYFFDE